MWSAARRLLPRGKLGIMRLGFLDASEVREFEED
jgi:hypothetical protein